MNHNEAGGLSTASFISYLLKFPSHTIFFEFTSSQCNKMFQNYLRLTVSGWTRQGQQPKQLGKHKFWAKGRNVYLQRKVSPFGMIISYYISLLYSSTYYKSVLAGELSRLNFSSFSTTSVKSGLIFIIVHFLASITITTHSCNSIWSSSSR